MTKKTCTGIAFGPIDWPSCRNQHSEHCSFWSTCRNNSVFTNCMANFSFHLYLWTVDCKSRAIKKRANLNYRVHCIFSWEFLENPSWWKWVKKSIQWTNRYPSCYIMGVSKLSCLCTTNNWFCRYFRLMQAFIHYTQTLKIPKATMKQYDAAQLWINCPDGSESSRKRSYIRLLHLS